MACVSALVTSPAPTESSHARRPHFVIDLVDARSMRIGE
jgi:hypothetical protein